MSGNGNFKPRGPRKTAPGKTGGEETINLTKQNLDARNEQIKSLAKELTTAQSTPDKLTILNELLDEVWSDENSNLTFSTKIALNTISVELRRWLILYEICPKEAELLRYAYLHDTHAITDSINAAEINVIKSTEHYNLQNLLETLSLLSSALSPDDKRKEQYHLALKEYHAQSDNASIPPEMNYTNVVLHAVDTLMNWGENAKAYSYLETYLQHSSQALYILGAIKEQRGQIYEAIDYYTRIKSPKDLHANAQLKILSLQSNNMTPTSGISIADAIICWNSLKIDLQDQQIQKIIDPVKLLDIKRQHGKISVTVMPEHVINFISYNLDLCIDSVNNKDVAQAIKYLHIALRTAKLTNLSDQTIYDRLEQAINTVHNLCETEQLSKSDCEKMDAISILTSNLKNAKKIHTSQKSHEKYWQPVDFSQEIAPQADIIEKMIQMLAIGRDKLGYDRNRVNFLSSAQALDGGVCNALSFLFLLGNNKDITLANDLMLLMNTNFVAMADKEELSKADIELMQKLDNLINLIIQYQATSSLVHEHISVKKVNQFKTLKLLFEDTDGVKIEKQESKIPLDKIHVLTKFSSFTVGIGSFAGRTPAHQIAIKSNPDKLGSFFVYDPNGFESGKKNPQECEGAKLKELILEMHKRYYGTNEDQIDVTGFKLTIPNERSKENITENKTAAGKSIVASNFKAKKPIPFKETTNTLNPADPNSQQYPH